MFITDVFADLVAGQLNVSTVEVRERRQREQAQFRKELEATQANEDELTDKLLKRVIDDEKKRISVNLRGFVNAASTC